MSNQNLATRLWASRFTRAAIYGLVGAILGYLAAGLAEPTDGSPKLLNGSRGMRFDLAAHVPTVIVMGASVLGLLLGFVLGAISRKKYTSDRSISAAPRAPRPVVPILFLGALALLSGSFCYAACIKQLWVMSGNNGHVTCVTILHNRSLGEKMEGVLNDGGELARTTYIAFGCLAVFLVSVVLTVWLVNRKPAPVMADAGEGKEN